MRGGDAAVPKLLWDFLFGISCYSITVLLNVSWLYQLPVTVLAHGHVAAYLRFVLC